MIKKNLNKKGVLLAEETIKIVIALICLIFLAYLLISIYFSRQDAKDIETATRSLENVADGILSNKVDVDVSLGPQKWFLFSWPYEGILPKSCSNYGWTNCICICYMFINSPQQAADKCDTKGICKNINQRVITQGFSDKHSPISIDSSIIPLKIERGANEIILKRQ